MYLLIADMCTVVNIFRINYNATSLPSPSVSYKIAHRQFLRSLVFRDILSTTRCLFLFFFYDPSVRQLLLLLDIKFWRVRIIRDGSWF